MYAKREAIEVPGPGDYGYDLMAGALIPPRGNGRITDIIIHIEQVPENNYLLADLRFPGSGNGIRRFDAHHEHGYVPRQSEFIFPYEAPTDGYVHSTSAADATAENKDWGYRSDYANYIYRVRSTEPRGPFYGKIYGMTEVSGLTVHFTYYLNPDGTRNLEWDRTRNLFEHLSRGEHAPQYP